MDAACLKQRETSGARKYTRDRVRLSRALFASYLAQPFNYSFARISSSIQRDCELMDLVIVVIVVILDYSCVSQKFLSIKKPFSVFVSIQMFHR